MHYFLHSLFTGPQDAAYYNILSSTQAYKNIMKNNVDQELSFNSWKITIQKFFNTSKSAIFADSAFSDWGSIYSKYGKDFSCLVRFNRMIN